ncbi:hypothetical protein [Actinomadura hibisca]|uniref:hypothetical protein n=1 Tax=Actinomadura hibisca TaxID=68565 RepID=UPI00082C05B5|nr:hypothetical protein [Actinomadura hibisca]
MDGKHTDPAPKGLLARHWRAIIPVGVATCAALAIGGGTDLVHRVQKDRSHHEPKPAAKQAAGKERTGGVPRYVVGVRRTGTALIVRDVRTGKDVGLPVAAPQGRRFQRIAAERDGSYVVSATAGPGKVVFQRLRLEKNGHPKDLNEVPGVTIAGASTDWSDLAVSPDGKQIAYVTYQGMAARLDVVSRDTRKRVTWTSRLPARLTNLSWTGPTLSFVWNPVRTVNGRPAVVKRQLRTLDTAGAGGDLKLSKAVMLLPKGSLAAVLSSDGRTVVAGVGKDSTIEMQAYSADTGKPTKVLWQRDAPAPPARISSDGTGGHLLAAGGDGLLYVKAGGTVPAADLADVAW